MRVYRLHQATNEVEQLCKKHRELWDSVTQFERLLSHGQTHGHVLYPKLRLTRGDGPASIWKSRIIFPPLGGKRSGLRYVYERVTIEREEHAIALAIYVHQEGGNEADVIARIRDRFGTYEATPDGLRRLDGSDTGRVLE